jgi:hypothetical protein
VSISAKHTSSVGQGFLRSKNILRESAVHFVSSIQSTSAQSAGDKTSLLPRKAAKEAKAQRIFAKQKYSAKIWCILCVKHTINICENLRNLRETKLRFFHAKRQRKLPKFRKVQRIFAKQKYSAKIWYILRVKHTINICENLRNLREKNFAKSILGLWFSYRPSTIDHRLSTIDLNIYGRQSFVLVSLWFILRKAALCATDERNASQQCSICDSNAGTKMFFKQPTLPTRNQFEIQQSRCQAVGNGVHCVRKIFDQLIADCVAFVNQIEHFYAGPNIVKATERIVTAAITFFRIHQQETKANVDTPVCIDG